MPKAQFTLTDADPRSFEVQWAWWGREQYFYDGTLLQSFWDLTTYNGERTFRAGGHLVRITFSAKQGFVTRVYVDEKLRVENLFPQMPIKREPFSWKRWLKTVVIWMLVGCAATFVYMSLERRQGAKSDQAKEGATRQ